MYSFKINSVSEDATQTTPPSVLRQRVEKEKGLREYLEKELDEIREFTMAERQILNVEKVCIIFQHIILKI